MKIIKKTDNSILFDLSTLQYGDLTVSYPENPVAEVECLYGPYPYFTIFKHKYYCEKRDGKIIRKSKKLVTTRYILINIQGISPDSVDVHFENKMYPLVSEGSFLCDREDINKMFPVCVHTLNCCIFPHTQGNATFDLQSEKSRSFATNWHGKETDYVIVDGARRDREVWVGDLYPEIRNVWSIFREKKLIRNTFAVIFDQIREDGYIPASSISMQTFYEYNCWFILVLEDYVNVSGDVEFYLENTEKVRRIMRYIFSVLEDGCLNLGKMQTWAWTSSRQGKITSSNCVLYASLTAMSRLETELGGGIRSWRGHAIFMHRH